MHKKKYAILFPAVFTVFSGPVGQEVIIIKDFNRLTHAPGCNTLRGANLGRWGRIHPTQDDWEIITKKPKMNLGQVGQDRKSTVQKSTNYPVWDSVKDPS